MTPLFVSFRVSIKESLEGEEVSQGTHCENQMYKVTGMTINLHCICIYNVKYYM